MREWQFFPQNGALEFREGEERHSVGYLTPGLDTTGMGQLMVMLLNQHEKGKSRPVIRVVNDHGIGLAGADRNHMQDLRVYAEGGSVQVWVEVRAGAPSEVMQYLTPQEAMAFAKAFERAAIEALRQATP